MIELSPGDRINDDLEIVSILGEGGMGIVYLVREEQLERLLAIKLLHPSLAGDDAQRARLRREATVLSKLRHKNLVRLYRYGFWKNQFPYLAMEYVSGQSLQDLLVQEEFVPPFRAIAIVSKICDGLHYAHSNGVIHRDLKPSNIVLSGNELDEPKIIDFGLAKSAEATQTLTQSGAVLGSYYYMSPEQCAGQEADRRSDLYALGCIFYELLSGKPPFNASTIVDLLRKHCSEDPPPLLCGTHPLPAGLDQVVFKLLQKEPADRYQTAEELQADLRLLSIGQGVQISGVSRGRNVPENSKLRIRVVIGVLICASVLVVLALCSRQPGGVANQSSNKAIRPKSARADLYRLYRQYFIDDSSNQVESLLRDCEQTITRIPKDDLPLLVQGYELYGLLCKKRMSMESNAANQWNAKGLDAFKHALTLIESKEFLAESAIRRNIADFHQARGDGAESYRELERALNISMDRQPSANFPLDPALPGTASKEEKATMMTQLSDLSAQMGNFAASEQWLHKCKVEANRIREPNRALEAVPNVCRSLLSVGRKQDAIRLFKEAESRLSEGLEHGEIADDEAASTYASLSSVPVRMHDLTNAVRLLKMSVGCLSTTDQVTNYINVERALHDAEENASFLADRRACFELSELRKRLHFLELRGSRR